MQNDVAIRYNAKLIEVEDNIKQLESLGMNAQNYTLVIENIKTETQAEVKDCYTKYNQTDSNIFLHDSLITVYTNAIKKLDRINDHILSEYDNYYKIKMEYTELNDMLKEINDLDISKITTQTLNLLNQIKKSSSIDFEEERELVENIYELVYTVIKLELIYTNNSSLLENIKSDSSNTTYITKLIKEDIQTSPQNSDELANKVKELNKVGLSDKQFLDKDLIMLLSISDSDKLTNKAKKLFLTEIEEYTNVSNQLMVMNQNNEDAGNRIIEIKKENRTIALKKLLKRISILINMGLVGTAIAFSIKGARTLSQDKEYKTVTTIYDTSIPEEDIIEEYCPSIENTVTLTEYSAWDDPGYLRDNYKRNVYNYDLSNVEFYEDVKDYLNPDLKQYITFTETVEVSSEKPTEEYSGNKYVITQVVQHKDEYRIVDDREGWATLSFLFSCGIVGLDAFLLSILPKVKLRDLKQDKKNNKQELSRKKQLLLETNTRIRELNTELFTLRKNIQDKYDSLPSLLQEDEKIKEKMLSLDNNHQN